MARTAYRPNTLLSALKLVVNKLLFTNKTAVIIPDILMCIYD